MPAETGAKEAEVQGEKNVALLAVVPEGLSVVNVANPVPAGTHVLGTHGMNGMRRCRLRRMLM